MWKHNVSVSTTRPTAGHDEDEVEEPEGVNDAEQHGDQQERPHERERDAA